MDHIKVHFVRLSLLCLHQCQRKTFFFKNLQFWKMKVSDPMSEACCLDHKKNLNLTLVLQLDHVPLGSAWDTYLSFQHSPYWTFVLRWFFKFGLHWTRKTVWTGMLVSNWLWDSSCIITPKICYLISVVEVHSVQFSLMCLHQVKGNHVWFVISTKGQMLLEATWKAC